MTPTFALALPHTPWVPERVVTLRRLMDQLGHISGPGSLFQNKEPNNIWSAKMWTWGEEQKVSHFVQLQDDVEVSPTFWSDIEQIVTELPDEIIALQSQHPAASEVLKSGHKYYTTSDGIIGCAYIIPLTALFTFNYWRQYELKAGATEVMSEDTLLSVFGLCKNRKFYHPVPSPIRHDTSVKSTYANDTNPLRETFSWRDGRAGYFPGYADKITIPHLGHMYGNHKHAVHWSKTFSPIDFDRHEADKCPEQWTAKTVQCPKCLHPFYSVVRTNERGEQVLALLHRT